MRKLIRSIYGLKEVSQWYVKFDSVITYFDFGEIVVDQCIYLKIVEISLFSYFLCRQYLLSISNIGLLKEPSIFDQIF